MSGDEAFEAEALSQLDFVFAIARSLTDSRDEADDLVQATYERALTGWRRNPPDDVRPWLATICRNAARDNWRRKAARPQEVWDDSPLLARPSTLDTEAQVLANLDAQSVHRAIAELPDGMREAITLVDLGGLTHEEAAQVLEIPRGTVLSRVHRGRKALAMMIRTEVTDHEALS